MSGNLFNDPRIYIEKEREREKWREDNACLYNIALFFIATKGSKLLLERVEKRERKKEREKERVIEDCYDWRHIY